MKIIMRDFVFAALLGCLYIRRVTGLLQPSELSPRQDPAMRTTATIIPSTSGVASSSESPTNVLIAPGAANATAVSECFDAGSCKAIFGLISRCFSDAKELKEPNSPMVNAESQNCICNDANTNNADSWNQCLNCLNFNASVDMFTTGWADTDLYDFCNSPQPSFYAWLTTFLSFLSPSGLQLPNLIGYTSPLTGAITQLSTLSPPYSSHPLDNQAWRSGYVPVLITQSWSNTLPNGGRTIVTEVYAEFTELSGTTTYTVNGSQVVTTGTGVATLTASLDASSMTVADPAETGVPAAVTTSTDTNHTLNAPSVLSTTLTGSPSSRLNPTTSSPSYPPLITTVSTTTTVTGTSSSLTTTPSTLCRPSSIPPSSSTATTSPTNSAGPLEISIAAVLIGAAFAVAGGMMVSRVEFHFDLSTFLHEYAEH